MIYIDEYIMTKWGDLRLGSKFRRRKFINISRIIEFSINRAYFTCTHNISIVIYNVYSTTYIYQNYIYDIQIQEKIQYLYIAFINFIDLLSAI